MKGNDLLVMLNRLFNPSYRYQLSLLTFICLYATACSLGPAAEQEQAPSFDGGRAMEDIHFQVNAGPRIPGSDGHNEVGDGIETVLLTSGWEVEIQDWNNRGINGKNIIGKIGEDYPWIILGTHYDTRPISDRDPDPNQIVEPVPGANDGASGVAILMEIARILPQFFSDKVAVGTVWLVFFDMEDSGRYQGFEYAEGSMFFVNQLTGEPDAVVIVDMVGDMDLRIYQEKSSNPALNHEIWTIAQNLGYDNHFIQEQGYRILDDHTPFLQNGIPAAVLIDFDYPYWHTTADTPDKISPSSLQVVGDTILMWVIDKLQSERKD